MTNQKKIMLLGGIRYLLPVIEAAHKHGYYVITADYLPDNIAHRYSDEYVNVSIIDKEAVLKVAQEKHIDGIMSFGVDPGVVSAAYVAEKMGLPNVGPYESVEILQNKDKFRAFLAEHNFNVPKAQGFDNIEDAINHQSSIINVIGFPMIVKPTDSAGSKGVTRVDNITEYEPALRHAFECSHCGHIIVEEFLEKDGKSSGSEMFVGNGKIIYNGAYDQLFDNEAINPYTPSAEMWPSQMRTEDLQEIEREFQRLIDLLHMKSGIFNLEFRRCINGKVYLMEVSPRAGGNRLAEVIRVATGDDLIDAGVCAAMGEQVILHQHPYKGFWLNVVLHSEQEGIFDCIYVDEECESHTQCLTPYLQKGDCVHTFAGANNAIGTAFLHFDNQEQLEYAVIHQSEWLKVIVK